MVIYRNEKFNEFVLDYIIENNKTIFPTSYNESYKIDLINKLNQYKRKSKDGIFKASYSERGATLDGRIFSKLSLQCFPCEVRNSLAISKYIDIDIKNSQFAYYYDFCKKNNIICVNQKNYLANREKLLKQSNITKKNVLEFINGDFQNSKFPQWLQDMKQEYKTISEILISRNQELVKFVKADAKKKGKSGNLNGKMIAQYYGIQEKTIIDNALKWCEANNFIVGTLIHDGFLLEINDRIKNEIKDLNLYIKNTGYDLEFIIKPMKDLLNIPKDILYKTKRDYEEEEKEKYEKLKGEFEETTAKILNPLIWITTDSNGNKCFEKHGNIRAKYIDWKKATHNGKILKFSLFSETGKPKTFIENYLNDPNKKSYDRFDFIPKFSECPDNVYNLFDGYNIFKLENIEYKEDTKERFEKLLNHFRFLVNDGSENTEEYFKYLIQFFAHIILNPMEKTKVVPILRSDEGFGKNIMTDFIGKECLNERYHLETRDPKKEVYGEFNGLMESKTSVVFDEADPEESKYFYDKLKGDITNDTIILKKKGIENTTIKSYAQFIATTNSEELPFKLSSSNRRFVCFECTQKKPSHQYFAELAFNKDCIMKDKAVQKMFLEYIEGIYDKDFNFTIFPKTKFYMRSYELCKVPINDYFNDYYQKHFSEGGEPYQYDKGKKKGFYSIQLKSFYDDYKIFLNDNSGELISQLKFKTLIMSKEIFKIERNNKGAELIYIKEDLVSYLEKNDCFKVYDNMDYDSDEIDND